MSLADNFVIPSYPPLQTGVSFSTFVLDETTDYYAVIFRAPNTNAISKLFYNFSSVNGTPTAEISLQGVTSGGLPDGTILSSGNAKASWTATATAGWQTLTSSYTPGSVGELLAYVVKITAGTSITVNVRIGGSAAHLPSGVTYNNTGALTSRLTTPAVWGIKGSGTTWCHGNPISSSTTNSITTASIVEEACAFVVPSWCSSIRVIGVESQYRMTTSATGEIRIYNGIGAADTTVAQSITTSAAQDALSGSSTAPLRFYFPPVTVNSGNGFRISTRSTSSSATIHLQNTVVDNEDTQAWGPWNATNYRSRRTTGNWTDSTKDLPFFQPIIDDVTAPSGGSGGVIIHPGMAGGMRG